MDGLYRLIDANINRASEGLRVLEDMSRFYYNNSDLTQKLKMLRHMIRKASSQIGIRCIEQRDSKHDIGPEISKKETFSRRQSLDDLAAANFKRLQEALRSLEEVVKLTDCSSIADEFERMRYEAYELEKLYSICILAKAKRKRLETDIYCLTDEKLSKGRKNADVVKDMINAGIQVIQYREKEKTLREKLMECEVIRKLTADAGVTFIVNDHIDIARLVNADGVHLGQDDLPICKVRELVGDKMIIGMSSHSPEQARQAVIDGADYIGVGPVFQTSTKKDALSPVGFQYLEYVAENINIPFVAIGGIKEDNIGEVASRGARCIALISEIVGAEDIASKVKAVREKIALASSGRALKDKMHK